MTKVLLQNIKKNYNLNFMVVKINKPKSKLNYNFSTQKGNSWMS